MLQISIDTKNDQIKFYQIRLKVGVFDAAKQTAKELEDIARSLVPVDTGRLRNSIRARVEGVVNPVIHFAAMERYAIYVEKGTRTHQARPYFYPAVDIATENFQQRIQRLLRP